MASNGSDSVHELQSRIRELEALRKTRSDEASRIIASQRSTIDRLRAENQRLAAELACVGTTDATAMAALVATGSTVSSFTVKPAGLNPAQSDRADKLMEVADTYSRKIEVEQRQLESLEREVELAQAQLLAARRDIGGHSGTQAVNIAPAKALKALETRLDATNRRFNEHIAANRELKQHIDAATRRQAGMEQVRSQLEREVASVAAELAGVQEAARVAQEARQEAMAQVAALRVSEDAEAAAFEVQVRELAACTAADERLLQAQAARLTKAVEAAEAAEGAAAAAGNSGGGGAGGGGGGYEPLDLDSVEQGIGAEAAAIKLQRAAGLSSLPEALAHYRSLEQRSFELFTACNEAHERITDMNREARELEAEVRQIEADAVAGRQHEAIRQVLGRRDVAQRRLEGLRERRVAVERRIAMLRTGIFTCLRKLGAAAAAQAWDANAPSTSGSGSSKRSSTSEGETAAAAAAAGGGPVSGAAAAPHPAVAACCHVMAGLALLEQRAAAIIAVQGTMVGRSSSLTRLSGSGGRPPTALLPSTTTTTTGPSILASAGASAGGGGAIAKVSGAASGGDVAVIDESDDDGEDEMPLTREQIQARSASLNSR